MHALLLSLFLLSPGDGPAHVGLHPSDAALYLEVPDASAVCALYDQAPLLRLLNDAEIQRIFEAIQGESMSMDVATIAGWVASALGIDMPAEAMQSAASAMSLSLRNAEGEWGLTAVLDARDDSLAGMFATKLKELAQEVGPHELEGFEALTGGPFPDGSWITHDGSRLALGISDATARGYAERSKGEGTSLASHPALTTGLAKLGAPEGTPLFFGSYTATLPLDDMLPAGPAGGLLRGLLDGPMTLRTSFADGRFVTRLYGVGEVADGLFGTTEVQTEWLADLPDDAMFTFASSMNGKGIASGLRDLVAGVPELSDALEGVELEPLFAPLGPRVRLSMQPFLGLGLPQTHMWIDCKDPAAFVSSFEALAAKLGEKVPGIGARTRDYRVKNRDTGERVTVPYTSLTIPPELVGQLGLFAPKIAFAQLDGELLVSLSSTALKSELKRIHGGGTPEPRDFLGKSGATVPAGTRAVFVFDWAVFFGKLVGVAKMMGPMFADNLPFDLALLPSPGLFARYLKPTTHVYRAVEGGSLHDHRSSFGLLTWASVAGAGLRTVGMMSGMGGGPRPGGAPVVIQESRGPEDELTKQTRESLRTVKSGIAIYKIENEALPDTLNVLVVPSADYPKGYLGMEELPRDGWGNDLRYLKEKSGYRLWSVGPNGRDESGDGDDVVP